MIKNMITIWTHFLKTGGSTITNYISSDKDISNFRKLLIEFIKRHEFSIWDYSDSFLEEQLREINVDWGYPSSEPHVFQVKFLV